MSLILGGTMLSLSSITWGGVWLGLEINMMAFLIFSMNKASKYNIECLIKYFLTQSIGSMILMVGFIFITELNPMFLLIPIMLKLGVFPLHFWLVDVNQNIKSKASMLLLTWQKLAPMFLMINFISSNMLGVVLLMAATSSTLLMLHNQFYKIMALSSIYHLSWMIASLILGVSIFFMYFVGYMLVVSLVIILWAGMNSHQPSVESKFNWQKFNQISLLLITLGGLPPFFIFFIKWSIVVNLMCLGLTALTFILVITALILLYAYLRLSYLSMLKLSLQWNPPFTPPSFSSLVFMTILLSLMCMPLSLV